MRAAVLYERGAPLVVEEIELAPPGPGEVQVKLAASGVCHSDLHHWKREMGSVLPLVLGHEGAGVVEAVGPGVTRVRPGDPVVIAFGSRCGQCWYCVRGMVHLCTPATPPVTHLRRGDTAIQQFLNVGSFAERTIVPATNVVPLPPEMPLDSAALVACGVATGVGAVLNTARVPAGADVLVIGAGGVGLNVIQGARIAGAARIIAADRLANKLALARDFGATDTIDATREDVVARAQALTGGRGVDYAFEVIGLPETVRLAYDATRKGGVAVVVGVGAPDADMALPVLSLTRTARSIIGCTYGSIQPQADFPRLVDLYRLGKLRLDELISRRFTLDQINDAFHALEAGEVARGVVVY
ncbi:MAG: Zn-dependent alcohol dehydrogenase [Chloroflexi bacterium]|nr:Zn-dependent alcohol dehydrogenase [Chloroflexota bacterium]